MTVSEMQICFMPERGTIDAVSILRRIKYHARGKKVVCVKVVVKAIDRVPRKVLEWALRKKEIPEVLVRSVMSLHEGAKTRVSVDSKLLEEIEANVGMHQGSMLSRFLFAVVVDIITEFTRGCAK